MTGADAIISALGPSMDRKATGLPLVQGTRLIIEAMKRHGVERFIGNGTHSIIDKRDNPNLQQKLVGFMGRTMLHRDPRRYRRFHRRAAHRRAVPQRGTRHQQLTIREMPGVGSGTVAVTTGTA